MGVAMQRRRGTRAQAQRHSCTETQDRRTGHTQRHGTEVRCTRCQATKANHDTHPTRALGTGYMATDLNPGTSKLLSTTVGTFLDKAMFGEKHLPEEKWGFLALTPT